MFAKVFGQIFDSSIAQDYTVRHMFIDLLILADATGAVDMTHEAIARRTNVPIETVRRCVEELSQPDVQSRSTLHEGKRIVPLDSHRNWGWQIVNYAHYRKIKDEEARRSYFRDYQRKRRAKSKNVKDKKLTEFNPVEIPSSSSSSTSAFKEKFIEWMKFRRGLGKKPKDWKAMFQEQWDWLMPFGEPMAIQILAQSIRNGWQGLFEIRAGSNGISPSKPMSAFEIQKRTDSINDEINKLYRADKDGNRAKIADLKTARNNLKAQLLK